MAQSARIAVIGTGWWATYTHIPGLQTNPNANLVAICDANPDRLKAAATAYNVEKTYTNYNEMFAQEAIDGVIVATSHATHYPIVRDCLAHNVHVLVEKPMTLYAADAKHLVELAHERGRELIVGYPWNYSPHTLRAREVVDSGKLGAPQFVSCIFNSYTANLLGGHDESNRPGAYVVHGPGAVYSQPHLSGGGHGHLQMTHSIGLMSFVTGLRAKRVSALMNNYGLAVDLVDACLVEFENGALGTIGGSSNSRPSKLDVLYQAERGAIDMDMPEASVIIREHDGAVEEVGVAPNDEQAYPRFAPLNNLVDIVLGRATNGSPGESGWRTVEILDAAYRSAKANGQPVEIADLY